MAFGSCCRKGERTRSRPQPGLRCGDPISAQPKEWREAMWGLILVLVFILFLIAMIPTWPYSRGWGYGPAAGVGVLLAIFFLLLWFGVVTIAWPWTWNRPAAAEARPVFHASYDAGPWERPS
nr:DUF3309 domain-containing protein [Microvirga roseola]